LERKIITMKNGPLVRRLVLLAAVLGVVAACGSSDDGAEDPNAGSVTTSVTDETVASDEPAESTPDEASDGAGTATVTFEEDGTTLEFPLDECHTSNTAPGNYVNVGPEGAFSSYGELDDGWELQLSVLPDANGKMINLSFLSDGADAYYQLEDLTFEVDGGHVTASASSDIYQTFDETEAIPLSFDVNCNG
jgi:hypothetical protein